MTIDQIRRMGEVKHVDLDLDVFVDGWRKKGNGYVWIQRGKDVKKYIPRIHATEGG